MKQVKLFHDWNQPRVHGEFSIVGKFSWLIGVEAFLETYHFATVHHRALGQSIAKNMALFDAADGFVRLIVPWRLPVGDECITKFCHFMYFVFPNTFFLVFEDHFGWMTIEPLNQQATRISYRGVSGHPSPSRSLLDTIEHSVNNMKLLHQEDVDVCESVARAYRPDRSNLLTRYEPAVQWFRNRLSGQITNPSSKSGNGVQWPGRQSMDPQ